MSDPRLTPFSGRVAHISLQGQIDAPTYTAGENMRVCNSLVDLLRSPDGPRDRQILQGARVCVIDRDGAFAYVQAEADGYCGWVLSDALGADFSVTHQVVARSTHRYSAPDLKSPERGALSLNAQLEITGKDGRFLRCRDGFWLPEQHLKPVDQHATDPVSVAESLLGTPYLWGGNSAFGVDCSGLVQLALHACGIPCPADSDQQKQALGVTLAEGEPPKRGDLLFWRGHVAWVSATDMILHANAHTMSVAYEPLLTAIKRIAPEGPVTRHAR
ncbi:MAG: C40 family peptidase, partial [Natronohydrobacter sp.]|nr:C40 family peptidase [Natronohydrobacter sp.]